MMLLRHLHTCNAYCLPQESIHCAVLLCNPIYAAPIVRQWLEQSYGVDILGLREAPEASVEQFRAEIPHAAAAHTKPWIVISKAVLI